MKLLFDFLPIILFFIAYQLKGIYVATAVVIVAAILQFGYIWFRHRRVDTLLVVSTVSIVVLGTITLLLHDDIFIKWKPTVIYWLFAIAFLASEYLFQGKSLIQRILGHNIHLPQSTWHKLNLGWVAFFALMGALNLFVVYNFSTRIWVDFKLFGALGLTVIFIIAQSIFLLRYIQPEDNNK